ncbi:MAG: hypothetical protein GY839_08180 [candidate division Zixibacteria bacterium]|nr:hypothetical protein [candidate division Zixibacteria bacterium]
MDKTDLAMLRHTLATLSYRAAKALRTAPESFADYLPGATSNTPLQILAHMSDLFDWAFTMISNDVKWHTSKPKDWQSECQRFFAALKKFDEGLESAINFEYGLGRMFQGPVADALTHTGQLTMLRRLHGSPMKGENYTYADIQVGRISLEQTPAKPKYEFD